MSGPLLYDIKYVSEVERQILTLDEISRTAFLEGMSHLVNNPFPPQADRSGQTASLNITQFLRITYVVSDRIIAVIAVIQLDDTKHLYREPS